MGNLNYFGSTIRVYLNVFCFNRIHVVFGQVIQGFEIIELIQNLKVDEKDRPVQKVTISHCGELIKKIKSNYYFACLTLLFFNSKAFFMLLLKQKQKKKDQSQPHPQPRHQTPTSLKQNPKRRARNFQGIRLQLSMRLKYAYEF
jgi:hypothetical protein